MPASFPFLGGLVPLKGLRVCFLVFLFIFPLSLPAWATTQPGTPVSDGETRLYVGHGGRFTAQIPANWRLDYSLDVDYSGRGGFIASYSASQWNPAIESLSDACASIASDPLFDERHSIDLTTWRDAPACTVETESDSESAPVGMIFTHPDPAIGFEDEFVAVITDAQHFDTIVESISFDPELVSPEAYVESAIDIVESTSIIRDWVDWTAVREEATAQLRNHPNSDGFEGAHAALDAVMARLRLAGGDAHNSFVDAETMAMPYDPPPYAGPTTLPTDEGIGFVAIPGFQGEEQQIEQFRSEILALVEDEASDATCGWIIDLRENPGGNMYPMLYGLAPLLQPGKVVGFREADGTELDVVMNEDGTFTYWGDPITWMEPGAVPSDPVLSRQPLAILIGPITASSGEATAIGLAARGNSRMFGEPTADMATSPNFYPLFDGSIVVVSDSWMTGPNGAIYPDAISPDVTVERDSGTTIKDQDPVVEAATEWLLEHPQCTGTTGFRAAR